MDYSTPELYLFLQKIFNYEPYIFNKIKSHLFYSFQNSDELKHAVSLYLEDETKERAILNYGHISLWDVKRIRNMAYLFYFEKEEDEIMDIIKSFGPFDPRFIDEENFMEERTLNFNEDISSWNISNVENMEGAFKFCVNFNQDLSNWDLSHIEPGKKRFIFDNCCLKKEYYPKNFKFEN